MTQAVAVKPMQFPAGSFIFLLTIALPASAASASAPSKSPDATTIIQRSVDAMHRDWQASEHYNHLERDLEAHGSKTFEILMIQGSPYQKLTAVNGMPLSPGEAKKEDEKLRREIASRCGESPSEKQKRIAKYQKDQKRDHEMIGELTKAFTFKVAGRQRVNGRQTWLLNATPKRGYQPPDLETKALTGMEGKLWIDTASFEWVRVEAHVVQPVSIEGFLATVEPGTVFELVRAPVNKAFWAPSHFSDRSRARIVGFIGHSTHDDETYSNYRFASSLNLPACTAN
ncbi:MAG TPA: hypothetical protein VGM43_00865 [Bryobacteraceae bacterium]